MAQEERATYLFEAWYDDTASKEEKEELTGMIRAGKLPEGEWYAMMKKKWEECLAGDQLFWTKEESRKLLKNIVGAPVKKMHDRWKWVAAASVILLTGVATLWTIVPLRRGAGPGEQQIAVTDIKAPQAVKAQLQLADGRIIPLDSLTELAQGDVQLTKNKKGQIVYNDSRPPAAGSRLLYNTLTNPRGSRVVDMLLSDGSHVWLNAGSRITYPVAFAGSERKVSITGEAYFEIAPSFKAGTHDKIPFIVSKGQMQVEVLGTHFNVNAYDDEEALKVTLLEGSVKVSNPIGSKIIQPGEQAEGTDQSPLMIHHSPDLDEVMAWKNGRFKFNGSNVESVMKQLSRWYDVEIVYQGEKPVANFRGVISRQDNISYVLKMLSLTEAVKFRIEGKKIIVTK